MRKNINMVNKRIQERMKKCYLSKSEMAKRLDMDYSTFWRKLNGEYSIDVTLLKRIAEVLGTSTAYLMGETDDPQPNFSTALQSLILEKDMQEREEKKNPVLQTVLKDEKSSADYQNISYWGGIVDNVQKILDCGDVTKISLAETLLRSALNLIASNTKTNMSQTGQINIRQKNFGQDATVISAVQAATV